MRGGKNGRDIRSEIEELKEKAIREFRERSKAPSAEGFLKRASEILDGERGEGGNPVRGRDVDSFLEGEGASSTKKRPGGAPSSKAAPGRAIEAFKPRMSLEEAVRGTEERFSNGGFYRILREGVDIGLEADRLVEEYLQTLSNAGAAESAQAAPINILTKLPPQEACYLDLETTGLSNSPLFLVGLMYINRGRLVVDQLFARDYTEEANVLGFAGDFLGRFKAVVTFNGGSFDLPFMRERMTVSGLEFTKPESHVDLLPISRKLVGRTTPNHKLGTLETHLLGRKRIDDVPGWRIPDLYHDFVRTGDAGEISGIIKHNMIDLVSMMRLIVFFLSGRGNI